MLLSIEVNAAKPAWNRCRVYRWMIEPRR